MKRYIRHPGVYFRKIKDSWVILSATKRECFELNETAGVLWEALKTPKTHQELLKSITLRYDIDEQTAAGNIEEFLATYQQKGFVREIES